MKLAAASLVGYRGKKSGGPEMMREENMMKCPFCEKGDIGYIHFPSVRSEIGDGKC